MYFGSLMISVPIQAMTASKAVKNSSLGMGRIRARLHHYRTILEGGFTGSHCILYLSLMALFLRRD